MRIFSFCAFTNSSRKASISSIHCFCSSVVITKPETGSRIQKCSSLLNSSRLIPFAFSVRCRITSANGNSRFSMSCREGATAVRSLIFMHSATNECNVCKILFFAIYCPVACRAHIFSLCLSGNLSMNSDTICIVTRGCSHSSDNASFSTPAMLTLLFNSAFCSCAFANLNFNVSISCLILAFSSSVLICLPSGCSSSSSSS
mmetsp:Transcript_21007/g.33563  ORF Transcript_21007/g.33563 Transcript_21007/m.33563 type:complete len:202 (+) Transcript_21007:982-1587(+)